jgi:leucyl aminopeptidase
VTLQFLSRLMKMVTLMKTKLSSSAPSQLDTECLVVVALDRGNKDKPDVSLETNDDAVKKAAAEVIANGEATGKNCEVTLIHHPAGLKARRLLLLGGGKAAAFTGFELRRVAGTAVRTLKAKGLRSFAFVVPTSGLTGEPAIKAIVEGAFVGNFDADTYKSDRKDQKIDELTVVASSDDAKLQQALEEARVVGESQNFTRELVNEPSNRMTPTMLADRAKKMAQEVGLKCEVYGADKIKELKMGAFWSVAQGSDEPPALIILKYEPAGAPEKPVLGLVERASLRHGRHIDCRRRHGEDEVRHGGRRGDIGSHARHRHPEAESESYSHCLRDRKHALGQSAEARRRADRDVRQVDRDHQYRCRRPPRPC